MVKIADVARHAQVSASTVSYVLSGKRPISEETCRRVRESIRELGYQPHAGARSLASRRANVLALVVPLRAGVHVPVVMQFVTSVATTARAFDHDVLLLTQDEGDRGLLRVTQSSMADGIIVMDVELDDSRLPSLRALRTPSVLIGFPARPDGLTCVDLDFVAAGSICVEHLEGLGHTSMALIGSPHEVYARRTGYAARVREGFVAAARRAGVSATVRPCDVARDAVVRTVGDLLAERPDLSAVVVHNEPIIETVMEALRRHGRRVPEDVSVLGICPDDLAVRLDLTAVALPADDMARTAVELVMSKLDGESVAPATLLPPRLTPRASTARAAATGAGQRA